MEHLLIVAHGSRRPESAAEVEALAQGISSHPENRFARTACAFLELAEPTIPEAIDECVALGARRIAVLPYFLTVGKHVVRDIPAILDAKRAQFPAVEIVQRDYIGKSAGMRRLLLESLIQGD